jgi:hypothetical protein
MTVYINDWWGILSSISRIVNNFMVSIEIDK